jgi:hypothetical protein
MKELVRSWEILQAVEAAVGPLEDEQQREPTPAAV